MLQRLEFNLKLITKKTNTPKHPNKRKYLGASNLDEILGKVRRAKLYYLRGLAGKKARIKERI